jgi:hypothetical protein
MMRGGWKVRFVRLLMRGLRPLVGSIRMLQGLPGLFVPGQVILFSMVLGGCAMRVSGQVVVFGRFLM